MGFDGKIALVTGAKPWYWPCDCRKANSMWCYRIAGTATSENGAKAISEYLGSKGWGQKVLC